MTESDVVARLGAPDVSVDFAHTLWRSDAEVDMAYLYGVEADFPTLGVVEFDKRGRVVGSPRQAKPNPGLSVFNEGSLRQYLAQIGGLTALSSHQFQPIEFAKAVNALSPLRESAIQIIEEFFRVAPLDHPSAESARMIARFLFRAVSDQRLPPIGLGHPGLEEPADPNALPHFPLVACFGYPFSLVEGFTLFGFPKDPIEDLHEIKTSAIFHGFHFTPTGDPFTAIRRAYQTSCAFNDAYLSRAGLGTEVILRQLIRQSNVAMMQLVPTWATAAVERELQLLVWPPELLKLVSSCADVACTSRDSWSIE